MVDFGFASVFHLYFALGKVVYVGSVILQQLQKETLFNGKLHIDSRSQAKVREDIFKIDDPTDGKSSEQS